MKKQLLTEEDFQRAAKLLKCDIPAIKAVAEVESSGSGFNADGTPKTLFEGHWFSRYTDGVYDDDYPTISYPSWTKKFYGRGPNAVQIEKERLSLACSLNRTAGLMSASWGKFQIMGFNHGIVGFKTVQQFVNAMYKNEGEHLIAFCNYVIRNAIDDELREHNWDGFAYRYNGSEYKKNRYAEKMADAWESFC